jgi:hypothetical protein
METTAGSSAKWNQPKYRAVGYTSYVDETLFGSNDGNDTGRNSKNAAMSRR